MITIKLIRKESESWVFEYNNTEYKLNECIIGLWNNPSEMIAGNMVQMLDEDLEIADK